MRNVSGAFALRKSSDARGKKVILVDDVMTTGSTMKECARILKEGGAAEVHGLTLARRV
jgi:predicted amidophosphoribosyltransferase